MPEPRAGVTVTWTGSQLLIWGGNTVTPGVAVSDGAAYTPNPL